MATDVPDSRSLDSWEEAFQYPIPTVRRVEQELRRDIASNKDKLRSLVGYVAPFSYGNGFGQKIIILTPVAMFAELSIENYLVLPRRSSI